jgi:hypothetical protein
MQRPWPSKLGRSLADVMALIHSMTLRLVSGVRAFLQFVLWAKMCVPGGGALMRWWFWKAFSLADLVKGGLNVWTCSPLRSWLRAVAFVVMCCLMQKVVVMQAVLAASSGWFLLRWFRMVVR